MKNWKLCAFAGSVAAASIGLFLVSGDEAGVVAAIDESCKESEDQPVVTATGLANPGPGKPLPTYNGVTYDPGNGGTIQPQLRLVKEGGVFKSAASGFAQRIVFLCAWDFDKDGQQDIIGAGQEVTDATSTPGDHYLAFYRNTTRERLVATYGALPDGKPNAPWTDPTFTPQADFDIQVTAGKDIYIEYAGRAAGASFNSPNNPTVLGNDSIVQKSYIGNSSIRGTGTMACGDFNNDGNGDFMYYRADYAWSGSSNASAPYRAHMYLGNGADPITKIVSFKDPYTFMVTPGDLGTAQWSGNFISVVEWNGDVYPDFVWGSPNGANGGKVQVFLNNGDPTQSIKANKKPKFNKHWVITNRAGMGTRGPSAVVARDFNNDGKVDIAVTGANGSTIKVYSGPFVDKGTNTVDPASYTLSRTRPSTSAIDFPGGATLMLVADFSLDGLADIVAGVDNFNTGVNYGGLAFMWLNKGATGAFLNNVKYTQQLTQRDTNGGTTDKLEDYDVGTAMQIDNDPDGTPDIVMADGNQSAAFQVLINKSVTTYVSCGSVISPAIDLGELADDELTVAGVTLTPNPLNSAQPVGTSTVYDVSNDGGNTWEPAVLCNPLRPEDGYCITFDSTVGNQLKWRATMCANAARDRTPSIRSMDVAFTYVVAENHFRAGPIASEGVIYVGAFREPGGSGQFFALSDETRAQVWNASDKLDARVNDDGTTRSGQTPRSIWTMTADNRKIELSVANRMNEDLWLSLQAADEVQAQSVIEWQQSKRFGLPAGTGCTTCSMHVMGAIESSTAAILNAPNKPYWYPYAATPQSERDAINAFNALYANRPQVAFVGSKDGALHAFKTKPSAPSEPSNGDELWAFIPLQTAAALKDNMEMSQIPGNPLVVTSYPDGSPTLANVKIGGAWRTVLIMGAGAGGRYVFALDVTDPSDSGQWKPLWSFHDGNMGSTYSKPAVVRVKSGTTEKWLAVFASGPGSNPDIGDTLYAVDIGTGELDWQFNIGDSDAYISSDITAVEIDDTTSDQENEPGTPSKDGFVDRVLFGDSKGRIWKVDPSGGNGNGIELSSIGNVTIADGPGGAALPHRALFSTKYTAGSSIDENRIIAGTIAAAEDLNGRMTVYFGTGGSDDSPNNVVNYFYGVHVDDGSIREEASPSELGLIGPAGLDDEEIGFKFYGGVVYNDGQLIFSTGKDLEGAGLCAPTAGAIIAVDANTFALQGIIPVGSKIVAPVYASQGAFYTSTIKGELVASEYLGVAGGGTGGGGGGSGGGGSGGSGGGSGGSGGGGAGGGGGQGQVENAFDVMMWRQVK